MKDREFYGQSAEQRQAMLSIIDKNVELRKIANMPPGVYEKVETPITMGSPQSIANISVCPTEVEDATPDSQRSVFTGMFMGMATTMMDSAELLDPGHEKSIDFNQAEYPIDEYALVGALSEDQLKTIKTPPLPLTETQDLQKKYAKFLNRDTREVSTSISDMDAAALREMKKGMAEKI